MIPPSFVITLKDNLGKQEIALNEVGIYPEIFKGVDGRKDEYKYHEDRISNFCNVLCTKSIKGCGLSHILLNEKIYKMGIPIALIFEDDAYPIDGLDIGYEIDKVLQEVPDDWEIIRLHCDTFCKDGTNSIEAPMPMFNGSTAAYLVNAQSAKKISETLLNTHIDLQQNVSFKIYKTKRNVFWTDESTSTNSTKQKSWISPLYNIMFPITSGEKTWDIVLSFPVFVIPFTNIGINSQHIINAFLITLLLVYVLKK